MAVDKELLQLDLYALLGVGEKASEKEVKKAYRQKALTCHPDKNPDNPRAEELFHQLSQALAVLTDAAARAAYDKVRKAKKQAAERTQKLDEKRKKVKLGTGAAPGVPGSGPRGTKRHALTWSGPETDALLEFWGEEESLQDPQAKRRNAEIYSWMATSLAERGHPAWTMEQVWSKVQELCQGMSGPPSAACAQGQDPKPASAMPSSTISWGVGKHLPHPFWWTLGLRLVIVQPEVAPEEEEQEGQPQPEEEEQETGTMTLSLEPVTASQDVSQASLEAWEGSSAGTGGQATPPQPSARVRRTHRRARVQKDLMHQHISVLWDIQHTLARRVGADLEWRRRAWGQMLADCDIMRGIMSRMVTHPSDATAPEFRPPAPTSYGHCPSASPPCHTSAPFLNNAHAPSPSDAYGPSSCQL